MWDSEEKKVLEISFRLLEKEAITQIYRILEVKARYGSILLKFQWLGRLMQEDHKFKIGLGNLGRLCLKLK